MSGVTGSLTGSPSDPGGRWVVGKVNVGGRGLTASCGPNPGPDVKISTETNGSGLVTAAAAAAPQPTKTAGGSTADQAQAEPERTREFFPETWVWSALTTDASGRGVQRVTAPDSITTWNFRAVALSKEKGLGIGEAELRVFQPFFVSIDLPYSAIRGEQFPVSIALYNYGSVAQQFTVELERADWFDLLDNPTETLTVQPKAVGAATFTIQPNGLGVRKLKVTARGSSLADAIIKEIIIEPEGVQREQVENAVLTVGTPGYSPSSTSASA